MVGVVVCLVVLCVRLNQLELVKLDLVIDVVCARSLQKVAYRWVPIEKWNFQHMCAVAIYCHTVNLSELVQMPLCASLGGTIAFM